MTKKLSIGDGRIAKLLYVFGLALFLLGMRTVLRMELDPAQLVLAVLLVSVAALQIVFGGLLVEVRGRLAARPG